MTNKSLVLIVLLLCMSIIGYAKERIVVLPFEDKIDTGKKYGEMSATIIEKELMETGKYEVINRSNLNKILDEQKLIMAGIVDAPENMETIGKISGSKTAIVGSVNNVYYDEKTKESTVMVEYKKMEVSTGKIIESYIFEGKNIGKQNREEGIKAAFEDLKEEIDYYLADKKDWYLDVGVANLKFQNIKILENVNGKYKVKSKEENINGIFFNSIEAGNKNTFVGIGFTDRNINFDLGAKYSLYKKRVLHFSSGAFLRYQYYNWAAGETLYAGSINNTLFPAGSRIEYSAQEVLLTPFIESEYELGKISIYAKLMYNLSVLHSVNNPTIVSKDDSNTKAYIENSDLKVEIDRFYFSSKFGFKYYF